MELNGKQSEFVLIQLTIITDNKLKNIKTKLQNA